jgi:hypothetical protein
MNFSISIFKTSNALFLIAVFVVLVMSSPVFYSISTFEREHIDIAKKIANNQDPVLYFGNSISNAKSHCDNDKRNLPKILADEVGLPVLDVSKGGMTISEFYDFAKFLDKDNKPSVVIIPITDFRDGTLSLPTFPGSNQLVARGMVISIGTGTTPYYWPSVGSMFKSEESLTYKGRYYGTYSELKQNFMSLERDQKTCPESQGVDLSFVEFMHWKNFGRGNEFYEIDDRAFKAFMSSLASLDIQALFYLTPVNYEVIKKINDPEVFSNLNNAIFKINEYMKENKINYIDLSYSLTSESFSDVYCACGHLGETGRQQVASALARSLHSMVK